MQLGATHLTVSDLDRSVAFYEDAIGLRVHRHEDGGGGPRRRRRRRAGARTSSRAPGPPAATPASTTRAAVSRRARSWPARRCAWSRHRDADRGRVRPRHARGDLPARPRRQRPRAGRRPPARARGPTSRVGYAGGPQPLDVRGLLAHGRRRAAAAQAATGCASGHVHLHVGDVDGGLRVLPRRARLRRDDGRCPTAAFVVRRRLPPPRRRSTCGAGRGVAARAATTRSACATGRSCSRTATSSRRATEGAAVRDPSGNAVLWSPREDERRRSIEPSAARARPDRPGVPIGHVHLRTADIDRVRDFYVDVLGFDVVAEARDVPGWGTTGDMLFLVGRRLPPPPRLQHLEVGRRRRRSPTASPACTTSRSATRRAPAWPTRVRRLQAVDWPLRQSTDHGTHEAIYISDPDGNDLELCWDRPLDAVAARRRGPPGVRRRRPRPGDLLAQ